MIIKIAIASHKNFYKVSTPILIESLLESGIEKKQIYVFISGFEKREEFVNEDIKHFELDHNSFEISPLIEIVEQEISSEYWFLIHDTCKVGNRFKELLYNIPESDIQKLSLKSKPSMSIGTYKYEYLLSNKEKILSLKNKDYSTDSLKNLKNWHINNEDIILWMTPPEPIIYNNNNNWRVVAEENWYNTGTSRRTEYYESLDLYKNKSNWGPTSGSRVIISL